MSEEGNSFINRAISSVFPGKERKPHDPESVAREAFLLANTAGPEGQEPLARYERDFDLRLHKPGAVFRLTYHAENYEDYYLWYALGKVDEDEVCLYRPYMGWDIIGESLYNLKLGPDWDIVKQHVPNPYVILENGECLDFAFDERFWKDGVEINETKLENIRKGKLRSEDVYKVTTIELMQLGTKEKVKEEVAEKAGLKILQPQTSEVTA